jgi:ketosteroid isomerase-like protein
MAMSNQGKLQEFYDARAKFDKARHLSFVHPECVYRIVGSDMLHPFTRVWKTISEIEEAATVTFDAWDLSQLETVSIHESGDTIYVHRRGNVGFRPDNSSMPTEFIDKLTFKDGAIIEYLQFVDTFHVAHFLAEKDPKFAWSIKPASGGGPAATA